MTREQLDAIRARVEAGTARGLSTQIEIDRDGTTRWVNLGPYLCATHEDAAQVRDLVTFIHAAPTDLRALLAEVERLRDAHAMAVQVSGELCEKCGWAMRFPGEKCRCELLAEVERLQKTIDAVGEVISQNGEDCDCDCTAYGSRHGPDCDPCLACRVDDALGEKR